MHSTVECNRLINTVVCKKWTQRDTAISYIYIYIYIYIDIERERERETFYGIFT